MYRTIKIENFRAFRALTVAPLTRVNLITGKNNVGKTALLEAIFLLLGDNPELAYRLSILRGVGLKEVADLDKVSELLWHPLFHTFTTDNAIRVEGQQEDGSTTSATLRLLSRQSIAIPLSEKGITTSGSLPSDSGYSDLRSPTSLSGLATVTLQLEYQRGSRPPLTSRLVIEPGGMRITPTPVSLSPGYFMAAKFRAPLEEDARHLGELLVSKTSYDVLPILRIVEPRLMDLRTIPSAAGTIIYGDIGLGKLLPLALMGDGLARLASIVIKMAASPSGLMLLDEVENGFHHTLMGRVWAVIGEAARRFDVQVFATTHSWECVRAAHETFASNGQYDFGLHRLERIRNEIQDVAYDQSTLAAALASELEVR